MQERSDTIDILQTKLFLDFTMASQQQLKAECTHLVASLKQGITQLNFDLLGLTVDSVKWTTQQLEFNHQGELLSIVSPVTLNVGDTISFTIHYHGEPQTDDSGWGGFYFSGDFAYNLGVGFAADPHSFGRSWFPCFDNFVERNTYSFEVLTAGGKTAYCNGELISETVLPGDSVLTKWELDSPIPSYLVSVAIGNLVHMESFYESISGNQIPMWLTANQQSMNNVQNSFVNLPDCMLAFESTYGPYVWNRVGFVFVPFNSGAMEHATNIAYPNSAANGSLQYETLMAHELSHHWWGDVVTCRTAEDMWLNEGWATYSEAIFLQEKYGQQAYADFIRANHAKVIRSAHINDGARLPVSGIGHQHTYGDHVYLKGADVAHSLRGYMGDTAFFEACKDFISDNQMTDVSSLDLRDHFQSYTDLNLEDFFNDRVFQPGYAAFVLESKSVTPSGNGYSIELTFQQRLHYCDEYYGSVPYELRLWDNLGNSESHLITLSGLSTTINLSSGVYPHVVELNSSERINDAVLIDKVTLHQTGTTTLNHTDFRVNILEMAGEDSLWILIENFWVAPDDSPWKDGFRLSEDRFWRIQGNIPESSIVTGRVNFWGNSSSGSYYDPLFFQYLTNIGFPEDSLIMLYRPDPTFAWTPIEGYTINTLGSNINMFGRIEFPLTQPGDYVWGIRDLGDGVMDVEAVSEGLMFPNPTVSTIHVQAMLSGSLFQIIDSNGKLVQTEKCIDSSIDVTGLKSGTYVISFLTTEGKKTLSFIKN